MSFFYVIILGIVQGLTEFLPVSSSGHMMLVDKLFGMKESNLVMSVFMHVATLLAVVIVFRKEVWALIRHPFCDEAKKIYLSFIPTCALVLVIKTISPACFNGSYLGFFFMLTAVLLVAADLFSLRQQSFAPLKKSSAFVIGIAQGFACIPGLSRSGTTIATGLMLGENREECARFSFLMSIPVILASLCYELIFDGGAVAFKDNILQILVGFLIAFLVGMLAIKFMLKIIKKRKFVWFSVYLVIISILTLIFF